MMEKTKALMGWLLMIDGILRDPPLGFPNPLFQGGITEAAVLIAVDQFGIRGV